MSIRLKAREKNLLLTCKSANKFEQVKIVGNGLRDPTRRKICFKYESNTIYKNSRKRSKTIRKSSSEIQMKTTKMTIKGSAKTKQITLKSEDSYKYIQNSNNNNNNNLRKPNQNHLNNNSGEHFKTPIRFQEVFDDEKHSRESKQPTGVCTDRNENAKTKQIIFVSLNLLDKANQYVKKKKLQNQAKLRRIWKNLQRISSYHRKQKIGKLRKYCSRKFFGANDNHEINETKPIINLAPSSQLGESNQSNGSIEKTDWKRIKSKLISQFFEFESNTQTDTTVYNSEITTPQSLFERTQSLQELTSFLHETESKFMNKPSPEEDISKIDEKYLKHIQLMTNSKDLDKPNWSEERINTGQLQDDEILIKENKNERKKKRQKSKSPWKSKETHSNNPSVIKSNELKEPLIQEEKIPITPKIEKESPREEEKCDSPPPPPPPLKPEEQITAKQYILVKISKKSNKEKSKKKSTKALSSSKENQIISTKVKPLKVSVNKKELLEILPGRITSKSEIREIWRRNLEKESLTSVSSRSSSKERPISESSDSEYLGIRSYKVLRAIVHKEVQKIFDNYQKKECFADKKENKTESESTPPARTNSKTCTVKSEESSNQEDKKPNPETVKKIKKTTKKPVVLTKNTLHIILNQSQAKDNVEQTSKQSPMAKDETTKDTKDKEDDLMNNKTNLPSSNTDDLLQTPKVEEPENDDKNLVLLHPNRSQEIRKKLKILADQENPELKISDEILKNWSIMHRLEKAFLALGTPTFPGKNPAMAKTKEIGGKSSNPLNEKVGAAKTTKTVRAGASSADDKSVKLYANSSKSKLLPKNLDIKGSEKLGSEPKLRKSKTEKVDPLKASKKTDGKILDDSLHSNKSPIQILPTKKSQDNPNGKSPGNLTKGMTLNKDQKAKIKRRLNPDAPNRNPRKITVEKDETSLKHKREKLFQTHQASIWQNYDIKRKPLLKIEDYLRQIKSSTEEEHPAFGSKEMADIEHYFSQEAKHFDSQIEKLLDIKPSTSIEVKPYGPNKIDMENLERKKTFAVFPQSEFPNLKLKKSLSCHKLEISPKTENVKSSNSTINQKCNAEFWDPFEQNYNLSRPEEYPRSNEVKKENKQPFKPEAIKDITHKNDGIDKTRNESDEGGVSTNQFPGFYEVGPNKQEKLCVKYIPQKLLFSRKEVYPANWSEREVKERSILSLRQNLKKPHRKSSSEVISGNRFSSTEVFPRLHEKKTPDVFLQRIFQTKGLHNNTSNTSAISTGTYDVVVDSNRGSDLQSPENRKPIRDSTEVLPPTSVHNISTTTFNAVNLGEFAIDRDIRSNIQNVRKIQPSWERDIRQYRAIVKDIINQYKRTNGFLKQNQKAMDPKEGIRLMEFQNEKPRNSNFRFLDINEYRRKIISEYKHLSIFEYKSKLQEQGTLSEENEKERGLTVVREITTDMDFDVKDFQPNIKNILDSQIYVDNDNFYKLKCLKVKQADHNLSLQEVIFDARKLGKEEIKLNEQSKSESNAKTNVTLPDSKVYSVLYHTPNHSNVEVDNDFTFDEFMSLSEFEEIETDV